MRKSIPSRICDRCGEPYELYTKGPRKAHALKVVLEVGGGKEPWKNGYPDLCLKCSERARVILSRLVFSREFDDRTAEELVGALKL